MRITRWFVLTLMLAGFSMAAAQQDGVEDTVTGNTDFAFDLYAQVRGGDANLFFSPHSIGAAFALAYAGADGETAAQMVGTLGFPADAGAALAGFALPAAPDGPTRGGGDPFILRSANALWAQQGFPWRPDFLGLTQNAGAPVQMVDYTADAEAVRQQVNAWVEQQTEDRIRDLLPPGVVDGLTRMIIANAVYFKASWQFPFDPPLTQDAPFTHRDGSTVNAPLMAMNAAQTLRFAQTDAYTAVALPYAGGQAEMVLLMPASGTYDAFEAGLTAEQWTAVRGELRPGQVRVFLPRFTFEQSIDLAALLPQMGMTDAFDRDRADFGRMYDRGAAENLYISAALHKAFVAVDEEGTEAAAATAVVMALRAMLGQPVDLRFDRPFVFGIHDTRTGALLFLGRVLSPAG